MVGVEMVYGTQDVWEKACGRGVERGERWAKTEGEEKKGEQ